MNENALRLVMNMTLQQPAAEILSKLRLKIGPQLTAKQEQVFSDAICDVYFLYGGLKILQWEEAIDLVAARPYVLDYAVGNSTDSKWWRPQHDIAEATRQLIHAKRLADARETLRTSVFRDETHTRFWEQHYAPIQSPADFLSLLRFESFRNAAQEKAKSAEDQLAADKGVTASKQKQSKCFIATATMETPDAPEVIALRNYRDVVLCSNRFGRLVVMLYELVSPPLARLIERNASLRFAIRRGVVQPLSFFVASREDRERYRR